jgi:hypothetical protein
MTLLRRVALGAALATLLPHAPAVAQDCWQGHAPPAGSWIELKSDSGTMRMALLGNETHAGVNMVRLEMAMTSSRGPVIMQFVVPGYPYQMSSIEEMVMKAGNQPAMKLSGQMLAMMSSHMPKDWLAEACQHARASVVAEENITVPAGTFHTTHYRDEAKNTDVWISKDIPFGLVKATSARSGTIVLTAKGSDAKSQITETPQEMPGMPHN